MFLLIFNIFNLIFINFKIYINIFKILLTYSLYLHITRIN